MNDSGIFLHDWAKGGLARMLADFGISEQELLGAEVLLASYTYEDYSGSAFVLFARDGKLYEVHGSHCSCYGLSESSYSGDSRSQWDPEETSVEALRFRTRNPEYGAALSAVLERYSGRG